MLNQDSGFSVDLAFDAQDSEPPSSNIFSGGSSPKKKSHGRRSRAEMMIDVLEAVKRGAEGPTQVMYKSNLSWSVCQDILARLVDRGLLEVSTRSGQRRHYGLSSKGSDILGWSKRVLEEIGD
jgi:predicted transcriptional regulator